jgi:hypothetical protein
MNAADGTHIATAYTSESSERLRSTNRQPQMTFGQTVDQARRTLFQASRNPRPPGFLPTGRRSLLDVMAKSRQDAKAANLQHAREQGQVPPPPSTLDPGLAPAAYSPVAPASYNNAFPATTTNPMAVSAVDVLNRQTGNDSSAIAPSNNARRGLVGMLFQPRDQQANQ